MNYGKEFIILYNKELSFLKKESIIRIEKDYESPELEEELHHKYKREIQVKMNEITRKDNKEGVNSDLTQTSLAYMDKKYKVNRIENIINLDIYNSFIKYEQYSQYKNFTHFIQLYSKFLALNHIEKKISKNKDHFCYLLNKKKIKDFFKIRYIKDDLNVLVLDEKKLKTLNNDTQLNEEVEKKVIKKENYDNPFTENEQFFLIYYLFKHERSVNPKLSTYATIMILKITSGIFANLPLIRQKDTLYEKFHSGYDYGKKPNSEKRKILLSVLNKIKPFKLGPFTEYLHSEYTKTK
jgi:hypothetical protein